MPRGKPRAASIGPSRWSGSGGLGLDLGDVAGRGAVDCDAARLHGLGDLALQLDEEQPVLEARALDLDVVGKRELALEVAGRDAAMQEGLFFLLGLASLRGSGRSARPSASPRPA